MIIDIKYHIASLVAVFLALAVGIAIGMAIGGSDAVSEQQAQIVTVLQQDFEKLRSENDQLQANIAALENEKQANSQFAKTVLPVLVAGRLFEKNLAVIELSDSIMPKDVLNTLSEAGSNIRSVTSLNGEFTQAIKNNEQQVRKLLGLNDTAAVDLKQAVIEQLAAGIVNGKGITALQGFEELGLVHFSGEYNKPLDGVIILGGSSKQTTEYINNVAMPLLKAIKQHNVQLVGTEFSTAEHSYIKYFQKEGLATVDNVDTPPGQLALVLVLEGKRGNYGTKKTAERLLPNID